MIATLWPKKPGTIKEWKNSRMKRSLIDFLWFTFQDAGRQKKLAYGFIFTMCLLWSVLLFIASEFIILMFTMSFIILAIQIARYVVISGHQRT